MENPIRVRVKEIIPRTYNVKSFRVEAGKVEYRAGQFLSVSLRTEQVCKRYLSLSSSPTERGYIEFTKKLTQSDFSRALDAVKPGDEVDIQYPFGNFTFAGECAKIAFISGGIGITPIRSIAKFVVDKGLGTNMVLLYANRTENDIVFREDLAAIQAAHPAFKVVHVLSQAEASWQDRRGYINAQVIKEEIPDYDKRRFYLCGPPAMVEAMRAVLSSDLMLPKADIITENFVGY